MKIFLAVFLFFAFTAIAKGNVFEDRAKQIFPLISQHQDSAFILASNLKRDAEEKKDQYGLVQSNYILGYISEERNEYGKAIIYYLEAIRYSENATYENSFYDALSLNKNCGVIFRKFKSYDLALEYYNKALELAYSNKHHKEIISIQYNISGVLSDQDRFQESINVLNKILSIAEEGSKKYFDILNRLSNTHLKLGDFDKVSHYSNKIINKESEQNKKLVAYSHHLLGKVAIEGNQFNEAHSHLKSALGIVSNHPKYFKDKKAEFEILVDLGINNYRSGHFENAIVNYQKAEDLIPRITQKPEYFELYSHQADLFFELGNYETSKRYEDKYSENLNKYLKVQEELIETDQRYNMDLITKRYFAEVEKQERIADILLYSRLISGTLLFLLLATIGFNRYQKVRLRKSIEKELVALNIVD